MTTITIIEILLTLLLLAVIVYLVMKKKPTAVKEYLNPAKDDVFGLVKPNPVVEAVYKTQTGVNYLDPSPPPARIKSKPKQRKVTPAILKAKPVVKKTVSKTKKTALIKKRAR